MLVATLSALAFRAQGADVRRASGLVVTFTSGERRDSTLASEVALYVEAGKSPTPFLPGGKFTATWEGAIHADLRGNYQFKAELNGALKVEINGAVVIDATGAGDATPLTKPIQLNKGANAFKATFTSPASGDAFARLGWTEKGVHTMPIPTAAFTHSSSPELLKSAQLRLGRELFLESRCIRCHTDAKLTSAGLPELNMDGPSLEGIGARRRFEWMAQWVLDPKALRPSARMPKLLSGPRAKEDAVAIAAYLASLQTGGEPKLSTASFRTKQIAAAAPADSPEAAADSKPLYERLHCVGCHNPPDAAQPDPARLSQKRIAEKFPPGKLAEYLRAPSAHYAWTRMPDFHLSADEAKQLEEFLFAAAPKAESKPAPTDATLLERGKKLVQTTGCLNCHTLKLENKFTAQPLEVLHTSQNKLRSTPPEIDCLVGKPFADYGFSADEQAALTAFAFAGFDSLARHVPAEFAERQTRLLNCNACHGQLEGFPALEQLGAKLKPEWMARFLAGDIGHKIRFDQHARGETWLEARMPSFKSRAALLAPALAAAHGFPAKSPAEPPVDKQLAEVGRKLVGKVGGYSCVLCHAVGARLSVEVFESEGINLAYSADRLQPSFFRRWLRAPTSVDPQTKMPAYFEEAQNQLTEVLDGDSEKQMSAIWEYLRLRDKMPAPLTGDE